MFIDLVEMTHVIRIPFIFVTLEMYFIMFFPVRDFGIDA